MYNLKKLSLRNFGSHKDTELEFKSGVAVILGQNETDPGQESNGSGKSFLIEGVIYALTGISFRKVSASELIMIGESECSVELELGNEKETHKIMRTLHEKKSSTVSVSLNGEDIKKSSVNDYNKYILDSIGLSKEDILDYFLISKEKYTSFFSASDSARKDLINRFSKSNLIDPVLISIQEDVEVKGLSIKKIESQIEKTKSSIQGFQHVLDSFDEEAEELVKAQRIESLMIDIEESQGKIEKKEKRVVEIDLELGSIVIEDISSKVNEIKADIKENTEVLQIQKAQRVEFNNLKRDLKSLVSEKETSLLETIECPECEHVFSTKDENFNKEKVEELIKSKREQLEEINEALTLIDNDINSLNENHDQLRGSIDKLEYSNRSNIIKRKGLDDEMTSVKRSMKFDQDNILRSFEEIDKLENKSEGGDRTKKIKDSIKSCETDLAAQCNELNLEERSLFDLKTSMNETKRFKGFMANLSLTGIKSHTNRYLASMKSNLSIDIEGFKELKSGDIKEKIDCKISKNGEDVGSFGKLSGGEKARVDIAVILAINSIVNETTGGRGINLIILDEIMESLDGFGIDSIINSMIDLNQNVLIVTHGKVNTNRVDRINVRKIKGVSYTE